MELFITLIGRHNGYTSSIIYPLSPLSCAWARFSKVMRRWWPVGGRGICQCRGWYFVIRKVPSGSRPLGRGIVEGVQLTPPWHPSGGWGVSDTPAASPFLSLPKQEHFPAPLTTTSVNLHIHINLHLGPGYPPKHNCSLRQQQLSRVFHPLHSVSFLWMERAPGPRKFPIRFHSFHSKPTGAPSYPASCSPPPQTFWSLPLFPPFEWQKRLGLGYLRFVQ